MKLVIFDGYPATCGNVLPEGFFDEFCTAVVRDATCVEDMPSVAADAELVMTNKAKISGETMAKLPRLRYIGILATGYNVVDVAAAKARGIAVTNIPSYSTASVAELAFAHILNLARDVGTHEKSDWAGSEAFSFMLTPQIELAGKTLGIFGFGETGRATAKIALAFGMHVLVHTRTAAKVDLPGVRAVTPGELYAQSDFISLHCPLTEANAKMIDAAAIAQMKDGAFLINTARGGLIDEDALSAALRSGKLAGAGLDVLSVEPPPRSNPLLGLPNCRITPHIAWATKEARERLWHAARENLRAFLAGEKRNRVV